MQHHLTSCFSCCILCIAQYQNTGHSYCCCWMFVQCWAKFPSVSWSMGDIAIFNKFVQQPNRERFGIFNKHALQLNTEWGIAEEQADLPFVTSSEMVKQQRWPLPHMLLQDLKIRHRLVARFPFRLQWDCQLLHLKLNTRHKRQRNIWLSFISFWNKTVGFWASNLLTCTSSPLNFDSMCAERSASTASSSCWTRCCAA